LGTAPITIQKDSSQQHASFGKAAFTGRILWLWNVQVLIPSAPFGSASSISEAKKQFKTAWFAFKEKQSAEKLAKVFAEMDHANRPGRYDK